MGGMVYCSIVQRSEADAAILFTLQYCSKVKNFKLGKFHSEFSKSRSYYGVNTTRTGAAPIGAISSYNNDLVATDLDPLTPLTITDTLVINVNPPHPPTDPLMPIIDHN